MASWSSLLGLPGEPLPLIGSAFDEALGLFDRFNTTVQAGVPELIDQVQSFEGLRTALHAAGLTVICMAGEAGCESGENIRVRFDHTIEGVVGQVPLQSIPAEILQGLAGSTTLSGAIDLETDVVFSIVFGVDSSGFFLDGSSSIVLENLSLEGSVNGHAAVGGNEQIDASGVANAGGLFSIELVLADVQGRYRVEALWSDEPEQFLRVKVDGDTDFHLNFAIGPADLRWQGEFHVITNESGQVVVTLEQMNVSGTLTLPELKELVDGVPEEGYLTVEAEYFSDSNTWRIDAVAESSAVLQLGGLTT